jgi:hypothetical protein
VPKFQTSPLINFIMTIHISKAEMPEERTKNIPSQITYDQSVQLDCRESRCLFNQGAERCSHKSPQLTLDNSGRFVCWTIEGK